jgi:hypothetical protein
MGMMDVLKSAGGVLTGMGTDPNRGWNEVSGAAVNGYRGAWNSDVGQFANKWTGIKDINDDLGDIVNNRGAYANQDGGWLNKIWNGASSSLDNNWMTRQEIKKKLNWTLRGGGLWDDATASTISDLGTSAVGSYFGPGWGAAAGALTSWANDDPYDKAISRTASGAVSGVLSNLGSSSGSIGSDAASYGIDSSAADYAATGMGGVAGGTTGGTGSGMLASNSGNYGGDIMDTGQYVDYGDIKMGSAAPESEVNAFYDAMNQEARAAGTAATIGEASTYGPDQSATDYSLTENRGPDNMVPINEVSRSSYRAPVSSGGGRTMNRTGQVASWVKTGLGAITNTQQQQALADEEAKRKQAMDFLAKMEKNPNSLYAKDPGLQQMRANRLNDIRAQYASKYGGTEGGAFARDMMAGGAAFDRQALNDAYNRRMGMVNATAGIPGQKAQYGGTGLGGITQAASQGVNDYYGLNRFNTLDEQNQNNLRY